VLLIKEVVISSLPCGVKTSLTFVILALIDDCAVLIWLLDVAQSPVGDFIVLSDHGKLNS
jgi:hypothetical protein